MSLIFYLAVFHKDEDSYLVEFPDLKGCFTRGKDMEEAYNNAKEALGLYLDKDGDLHDRVINKPSKVMDVTKNNNDGLVLIVEYDSLAYGKKYENKAIKKTLSIPERLNDIAVKNNVIFSGVLQETLIEKLHLK